MSIAILVYLTSLFLSSFPLAIAFCILCAIILVYYNQRPYRFLLICFIMLVSSLRPYFSDEVIGLVVSKEDNLYRILTPTHSVSIFVDQHLDLDLIVKIKGEYKQNDLSNKKRYQTFYSPKVETLIRLPSIRRELWNNLSDRPKLQSIIFSMYNENESLLASQGWYLSGFLLIIRWIFKPAIGTQGVLKLRRIILCFYFFGIKQSVSIFRLLIGSILCTEKQVIVFLCLFPRLSRSGFFYLVYGPCIFSCFHSKLNQYTRILRIMIVSTFLNKINFVEIMLMPFLKVYAGFQLIFATLSILVPRVPYEFLSVETVILSIKAIPLEIVGHISFLSILIYCILVVRHKLLGLVWLISVYTFVVLNPITTITFIDVGQGDASLINTSFNQGTVLIDTGKPSAYKSLQRELQKKGIKKIDTLIITHDDLDHSGNYESVMQDYVVDRSVREKDEFVEDFEFFLNDRVFDNINDNSLILKSNLDVLFTGDAGILQEYLLSKDLRTQSRVLKLGHHGSKTSSSMKYLLHVKPKIAIISSDPTSYGHPHNEVLKNLYDSRIPYLQTSEEGSITFYFICNLMFYITENGRFGFV